MPPLEHVFILTGGDGCVHAFRIEPKTCRIVEYPMENFLPEVADMGGNIVMSLAVKFVKGRRLVAAGCRRGSSSCHPHQM